MHKKKKIIFQIVPFLKVHKSLGRTTANYMILVIVNDFLITKNWASHAFTNILFFTFQLRILISLQTYSNQHGIGSQTKILDSHIWFFIFLKRIVILELVFWFYRFGNRCYLLNFCEIVQSDIKQNFLATILESPLWIQ